MRRHILFCSDFPLGYHNREAEIKLAGFAARGYGATYVEKLGIRNPRPRHAHEVLRRLRTPSRRRATAAGGLPFATCAPRLLVPRRAPGVEALNRRWLARQLLAHVPDPAATIPWVRFSAPELVPLAERPEWPLVVYEVVDDHEHSPGMDARLRRVLRAAEDRVLRRAGLVFAWSEPLARRLRERHPNVVLAPAAADLPAFERARDATRPNPRVAAYAGALDFRLDAALVAEVAARLPDWTFRLAGPADAGARETLTELPNVQLLGPLPAGDVPAFLASATVCLMPYRQDAFNDNLFPIKLVESLASGRPTVSTPILAAREFADVLTLAPDPAAFAAGVAGAEEDAPGAAARRVQRAVPYGWERRIDAMLDAVEAALR